MISDNAAKAIEDARRVGRALLKYISPNDTGLTGGHQYGFYLPRKAWSVYTTIAPEKGVNAEADVQVTWHDGRTTSSTVRWYGCGTRSEYRLTRFGRGFPWRTPDRVGALLVLVPVSFSMFHAFVLESEEDITEIQVALDVDVVDWATYPDGESGGEPPDSCITRLFNEFVSRVESFPDTRTMSVEAREVVSRCISAISERTLDERLLLFVRSEIQLFRLIERKVFEPQVARPFRDLDDFVDSALRILNARKARAGRALENHIEFLLDEAGVPFQMRVDVDGTRPDILIPGKVEYEAALSGAYPREKLMMLAVKTTCKDRWRQILNEAPLIRNRHLLTLQEGISPGQLAEMHRSNVVLVVPSAIHSSFPPDPAIRMLDVQGFVEEARRILS